mmetsp:Transcript_15330/g.33137  ORF Transcript_15330/g.33137 Transcript_15330/m.33137 type:complete len:116 (+) Transcript_15330:171-518(+)
MARRSTDSGGDNFQDLLFSLQEPLKLNYSSTVKARLACPLSLFSRPCDQGQQPRGGFSAATISGRQRSFSFFRTSDYVVHSLRELQLHGREKGAVSGDFFSWGTCFLFSHPLFVA